MPRTGIKTAPGQGPELQTITRPDGTQVAVVTSINVGSWGYHAGVSGTIQMDPTERLLSFTCLADVATVVKINDGDSVNIPEGGAFSVTMDGDVYGPKIEFINTASYFVQFVVE